MKPDFRTTAYPLAPAAAAPAPSSLHWISAHVIAWWRDRQQQRHDRLRLEALAPLDTHLLHDIGVSDELRSRALAQRESHYERFARSASEAGGFASRFGP